MDPKSDPDDGPYERHALKIGLVLVPTPLGNLRDITLRAIDTLAGASLIVSEDSRVTRRLLNALKIGSKDIWTYHEHNARTTTAAILERARVECVAVVTDAGTPGISDPGSALVRAAREAEISVEVLPGATAFVCAAVLSGFDLSRLRFAGFTPRTSSARRKAFRETRDETTVWYESPHRIRATLTDIAAVDGRIRVFLVRELSKLYEQQLLGFAATVANALPDPVRGEISFVIEGTTPAARLDSDESNETIDRDIDALVAAGESTSAIAKKLAEAGRGERRHLYARVSARRRGGLEAISSRERA